MTPLVLQTSDLNKGEGRIPHGQMTSKDHNPVFQTDKWPQEVTIYGQTTSKDHNPVFHTDKWPYKGHNPLSHAEIWPQEVTIWYYARTNGLKRSQSGISHRQTTSKDHNPVFHTEKWPHKGHNPLSHTEIWPQEVTIWYSTRTNDLKRS